MGSLDRNFFGRYLLNEFCIGMLVSLFENAHYSHGITLTQKWDRKVVITLNARNDHDRLVIILLV